MPHPADVSLTWKLRSPAGWQTVSLVLHGSTASRLALSLVREFHNPSTALTPRDFDVLGGEARRSSYTTDTFVVHLRRLAREARP